MAGESQIVFLGDYLDPYWDERILPCDASEELEEILLFKEQYPERVTLLLGNHDLHYLDSRIGGCRYDFANASRNKALIWSNLALFDIGCAFEGEAGDCADAGAGCSPSRVGSGPRQYLLTHAGVLCEWWTDYYGLETEPTAFDIARKLNVKLHDAMGQKMLLSSLCDVSPCRGGRAPYGSPVWADINEQRTDAFEFDGIYQIFGHTKQRLGPRITPFWACLDCSRPFTLDLSSGLISEL